MIGINEELKTIEAAMAVLSTNPNSNATIKVLRQAKYVAALAMTTLPSDKPLNDARHAVVIKYTRLKVIQRRSKKTSTRLKAQSEIWCGT
jgi:hypothetical protein